MTVALHRFVRPAPAAEPPRVAVACADGPGLADAVAALERRDVQVSILAAPSDGLAHRLAGTDIDVLVLIYDIERPVTSKVLRRLRRQVPAVRTVVVSPDRTGNGARRALNLGADGFVAVSQLHGLAAAIEAVHNGLVCVPRAGRRAIAKPSFSQREKEILALVTTGSTNQEIAARLYLTESTVKSHLATAFEKLGVRSRKEAAALLLDPDEGLQATALPSGLAMTPVLMHPGGAA
jgi:DNA-binding NarL/FixJ family response regulator